MKKIIFFCLFLHTTCTFAGEGTGKVTFNAVGWESGTSHFIFLYTTTHSNKPACNTYFERWVLDMNRPASEVIYSFLLAAATSGKDVYIEGTGTCSLHADSETVNWVRFNETMPD